MLKTFFFLIVSITTSTTVFGQSVDTVTTYFDEIKLATQQNRNLWGVNLYAPILLVQSENRLLYANFPDSAGHLKKVGSIYKGELPQELNIANTSVHWSGKDWAMIILPLPGNKNDRINLLAHELFHRAQKPLGFTPYNPTNNHLDQKNGRVYLRLELEALKKALFAASSGEMNNHLLSAFVFRKYRRSCYVRSDSTENLLELNEGISEFTGVAVSGRNDREMRTHFIESINSFLANPTFVRSFAYETTPIYGYLLSKIRQNWNKDIHANTDLTNYFQNAFNIRLPENLGAAVMKIYQTYNGEAIIAEEILREETIKKLVAEYKSKFIEKPHFDLHFENMTISFDYRNIMPLEDKGTVYPSIRVVDNWGILTVQNGALLSSDWSTITVSFPTTIENKKVSGDGWTLELADGYSVQKENGSNDYCLNKK